MFNFEFRCDDLPTIVTLLRLLEKQTFGGCFAVQLFRFSCNEAQSNILKSNSLTTYSILLWS